MDFVREPSNTWSDISFMGLGLYLLYRGASDVAILSSLTPHQSSVPQTSFSAAFDRKSLLPSALHAPLFFAPVLTMGNGVANLIPFY